MEGTSSRMPSAEEYMSLSLYNSSEEAIEYKIEDVAAYVDRASKRPKYHRHNSMQIKELERFFKEDPHPNDRQRLVLSRKLGLEKHQIKYWFQNKRTQLKAQADRNAITVLQEENEKLRMETNAMKMAKCKECGGSSSAETPMNDVLLRMENARLKKELMHTFGMLNNLIRKPNTNDLMNSFSQLGLSLGGPHSTRGVPSYTVIASASSSTSTAEAVMCEYQNSGYLQIAAAAMNELIVLAAKDSPLWLRNLDGEKEMLNKEQYDIMLGRVGANPPGFVYEATRATGFVANDGLDLKNVMMQPVLWGNMFPCLIGKVSVIEILYDGLAGTHDGELLLMNAEILFPTPLVRLREIRFLRYCKRHFDGSWVIVDVSIDPTREDYADVFKRCRKLPSGCVIECFSKDNSRVTFIEHYEYDESMVHSLFRPVMRSGSCFGAERWLATMQRQCECYALLTKPRVSLPDFPIGITMEGRLSIAKLMKRVVDSFCFGICDSKLKKWDKLWLENIPPETKVMSRVNLTNPGEHSGIILSLSKCEWLPFPRHSVFEFLSDPHSRPQWDLLADRGPAQQAIQIHNNPNFSDCITLVFPSPNPERAISNVILQHAWEDKVSSTVAYASADLTSISAVMGGEDSSSLKILPSGFVINDSFMETSNPGDTINGSLVTVGIQILMSNEAGMITMDSIQAMNAVMSSTIHGIRAALVDDDEVVG
ncbi:hypothetical protein V2J09_014547 [Rumex salicifolius]